MLIGSDGLKAGRNSGVERIEPKPVENMKRSWLSSESHGELIEGWSRRLPLNGSVPGGWAESKGDRARNAAIAIRARFIMEPILNEQTTDRQQKFRPQSFEGTPVFASRLDSAVKS